MVVVVVVIMMAVVVVVMMMVVMMIMIMMMMMQIQNAKKIPLSLSCATLPFPPSPLTPSSTS